MEFDGEDTFFGWVVGLEKEFGSFSLSELQSVTGPMGLKIERDIYFEPQPISQVMKEHGETFYQAMTIPKSTDYKVFRASDGELIFAGNKKDTLREFKRLGGTKAGYQFFFTRSETMPKITPQYSTTGDLPYTLTKDRFQISCSYCGLIGTEKSLSAALQSAKRLKEKHNTEVEVIEIFDSMAQKGTCELWDVDGHCIGYKKYSEQLPQTKEQKTLAAFMEMSEWYCKNLRHMTVKELRPIASKYFGTGEELTEFYEYLASPEGEKAFRRELRDAMRRHSIALPPEEEWLPLADLQEEKFITISFKGDTTFKAGEIVSKSAFEEENVRVHKLGLRRARGWSKSKGVLKSWGNGEKSSEELEELQPATVQGEPVPEKYRDLIPFMDEPLPPGTDFLVPAVVVEEGERKIDAVLRQLKDGVEGIQDSSQYRLFLTTMSKFHNYSIANLILIARQKPGATRVAGFVTWKDLGRWVKKGESGIAILAPVLPPKPKKEEGEEEEEVQLTPIYFKVVNVFDISQTEGKPLPEFDVPVLTGEANEELFANMLALDTDQGLDVSFESRPHLNPELKGQLSGKSIWVKPDEARAQQLKSLLHETAHYYSEGVFRIPKRDAETIAESAAYAVGAHFGFDSGTRSFPYVALWAKDKKVLQANLAAIRKVTTVMLEGLEKMPRIEGKLVPALKPFEPYHFAEYVLRYNRFSDAEIPIYSGLTGMNPLRVPDHIWREVIEATDGEFVKQGDINVFFIAEKERPDYMRAAPTWRDIASTLPTGTCYEDAWRYLLKEEEGELVHGSVQTIGKRINHAWVELPTGFIWEPESEEFIKKSDFYERAEPQVQARFSVEEASVMAARTKNFGPWTEEEVVNYLKRKSPAVIPTKPSIPSPREELEFVADSPELIPFTIEDIGYRDKLDQAFEAAIARVQGK